jgi:hypothetical protein
MIHARKIVKNFVFSVRHAISSYVWSQATAEHPLHGFSLNFIFEYASKHGGGNLSLMKIGKE